MEGFLGELAALLAALLWAFNSLLYTVAGRRVGSNTVNTLRIWLALFLLTGIHLLIYHTPLPWTMDPKALFYLAMSGVVGLVIGDGCLFEAFVLIGARLGMLMMLLVPIFSTIFAWLFLHEKLVLIEIVGIFVTVLGIAWVIFEKNENNTGPKAKLAWGIFLGALAAFGQALGLLFSKMGMKGGVNAISANWVRMAAAAFSILVLSLLLGRMAHHWQGLKNRKAFLEIGIGAVIGPVLGVCLSLVAIVKINVGIASTLMSLSPVMLIPLSYVFFKERVSVGVVIGTFVALMGAMILFFC
jgi:drug/metabolite transporter (DMT)-like permease